MKKEEFKNIVNQIRKDFGKNKNGYKFKLDSFNYSVDRINMSSKGDAHYLKIYTSVQSHERRSQKAEEYYLGLAEYIKDNYFPNINCELKIKIKYNSWYDNDTTYISLRVNPSVKKNLLPINWPEPSSEGFAFESEVPWILLEKCPRCNAPDGNVCVNVSNNTPLIKPHDERINNFDLKNRLESIFKALSLRKKSYKENGSVRKELMNEAESLLFGSIFSDRLC